MKIIFLTLVPIKTLNDRGIYHDLLKKFKNEGHDIFVLSPVERRFKEKTRLIVEDGVGFLQIRTLNIQKTNIFEKGLSTLLIEYQFLHAIKKVLKSVKFDLVLFSTPPITFEKVVRFIKNRDQAYAYLLLKDIFPQNAVDMRLLKKGGIIHRIFLRKERKLYKTCDKIGCMSEANLQYIIKENEFIDREKIEVNPNSIEPIVFEVDANKKESVFGKYYIPLNKKIFVYGGNLGKPQGLDFLLQIIETNTNNNVHFLIIGDGTEYEKVSLWFSKMKPINATLMKSLPKQEFDIILSLCDVGLIFLDRKFTIPNFPSRLLSYLEMKIPVIAATDECTDLGEIIETNKCGYKVLSGDLSHFHEIIDKLVYTVDLKVIGLNGYNLLNRKYTVDISYKLIMDSLINRIYV